MGLFRVFLLQSYKWIGLDWVWVGWDLCVGLLYEHRFAMLLMFDHCHFENRCFKTLQELQMLSTVTLDCQVTKIVMNSDSQL